MKKSAFILVLMLLTSLFVNAQTQNVELGLQVGAGFFLGNKAPAPGVTRLYEFAWVPDTKEFPAFEAFGGFARYRFNHRWAVQLQAMHQRVRFTEYDKCHFYNSMWNTDMMAGVQATTADTEAMHCKQHSKTEEGRHYELSYYSWTTYLCNVLLA